MKKEYTVWFASRRVRSGEIDLHVMAVGYLAAAAAATGKSFTGPLSDGTSIDDNEGGARVRFRRDVTGHLLGSAPSVRPPVYPPIPIPVEEDHWDPEACYDYDNSYVTKNWGNADHGLVATESRPFYGWRVTGVPSDCDAHGMSYLRFYYLGEANLTVEGPPAWCESIYLAFKQALAPWDIVNDEEGPTVLALETALGRRIDDRHHHPWSDAELAEPEKVLATSDSNGPAGQALRFLVAVGSLSLGRLDRADELLTELEQCGRKLRFSHGVYVLYSEGKPVTVDWEEHLPFPMSEVRLARVSWLIARGDKREAKKRLHKLLKVRTHAETRAHAKTMLAWLAKDGLPKKASCRSK